MKKTAYAIVSKASGNIVRLEEICAWLAIFENQNEAEIILKKRNKKDVWKIEKINIEIA